MMRKIWTIAGSAFGLVFLAGAIWSYTSSSDEYPSPFCDVLAGKIYRSAQPNVGQLERMKQNLGLKTILNLRGESVCSSSKDCREEAEFARKNGLKYVVVGFRNPPTSENVRIVLEVLDDERNFPVLIHCELGKVRTGNAVAIYRIERMGWTSGEATLEMLTTELGPKFKHASSYRRSLYVAGYRPVFPAGSLRPPDTER